MALGKWGDSGGAVERERGLPNSGLHGAQSSLFPYHFFLLLFFQDNKKSREKRPCFDSAHSFSGSRK